MCAFDLSTGSTARDASLRLPRIQKPQAGGGFHPNVEAGERRRFCQRGGFVVATPTLNVERRYGNTRRAGSPPLSHAHTRSIASTHSHTLLSVIPTASPQGITHDPLLGRQKFKCCPPFSRFSGECRLKPDINNIKRFNGRAPDTNGFIGKLVWKNSI